MEDRVKLRFHAIYRILLGMFFLQHGLQKLFGVLGGSAQPIFSLIGFAGIVEFVGGLFVMIGLFTRYAAMVNGFLMLGAYVMMHMPNGLLPILNGGELALLYLIAFIPCMIYGAGDWSIEKKIRGMEL